jgi:hypothetical protein
MAAARAAVLPPEHDVGVEGSLSVLLRDVAVECQKFHLFWDGDLSILVCLRVNQATVAEEKAPTPVKCPAVMPFSLHHLFSVSTTSSPRSKTSRNCMPCSV